MFLRLCFLVVILSGTSLAFSNSLTGEIIRIDVNKAGDTSHVYLSTGVVPECLFGLLIVHDLGNAGSKALLSLMTTAKATGAQVIIHYSTNTPSQYVCDVYSVSLQ